MAAGRTSGTDRGLQKQRPTHEDGACMGLSTSKVERVPACCAPQSELGELLGLTPHCSSACELGQLSPGKKT